MTITEQRDLIEAITHALRAYGRVEALYLSGSLAKGTGDEWSDVDTTAIIEEQDIPGAIATFSTLPGIVAPCVFSQVVAGRVVNCIAEDWRRFDITFVTREESTRMGISGEPLFASTSRPQKAESAAALPTPPPPLLQTVHEFIRVYGLSPVVIGRSEYIVALSGIEQLRRHTIDMMLAANGIGATARGGALHLNPLLTEEQRCALESLPPVAATRDSATRASQGLATLFFPLARRVLADADIAWPDAFEAATLAHLRKHFGESILPSSND